MSYQTLVLFNCPELALKEARNIREVKAPKASEAFAPSEVATTDLAPHA